MSTEDYIQDMKIEPDELDLEWLGQPQLMVKYSAKLAEAKERRDLMKEEVDLMRAECDRDIRKAPEKFGLEKITETAVSNAILTIDDYKDAQEQLRRANYDVNVLQGVVSAIEQRKAALENMVRLLGQNYFAGPSIPRNLQEEMELKQKESNKKVKLKRKSH